MFFWFLWVFVWCLSTMSYIIYTKLNQKLGLSYLYNYLHTYNCSICCLGGEDDALRLWFCGRSCMPRTFPQVPAGILLAVPLFGRRVSLAVSRFDISRGHAPPFELSDCTYRHLLISPWIFPDKTWRHHVHWRIGSSQSLCWCNSGNIALLWKISSSCH